jgi:hypothetical protein
MCISSLIDVDSMSWTINIHCWRAIFRSHLTPHIGDMLPDMDAVSGLTVFYEESDEVFCND